MFAHGKAWPSDLGKDLLNLREDFKREAKEKGYDPEPTIMFRLLTLLVRHLAK